MTETRRASPREWIARIRHTLATLGPKVQATRMVRDYTQKEYVPAANASAALAADGGAPAKQLAAWKAGVRAAWPSVAIRRVASEGLDTPVIIGREATITADVDLGGLSPDDVAVQMLSGPLDTRGEAPTFETVAMEHESSEGGVSRYVRRLTLDESGPWGYTVRVVPAHPLLSSDAALGLVVQA